MEVAWFLTGVLIFCLAHTGLAQTNTNCDGIDCTAIAATPCCDTTVPQCVVCRFWPSLSSKFSNVPPDLFHYLRRRDESKVNHDHSFGDDLHQDIVIDVTVVDHLNAFPKVIPTLTCKCCSDTECPPTGSPMLTICDVSVHTCVECLDDDDCADGPTSVCNTLTGQCAAECNNTGDCGANESCVSDQCVCSTDMDPCNDENESCDADGNCECDDGFVRVSGECVQGCDPACTGGKICTIGRTCICPGGTVQSPTNSSACISCDLECRMASDCRNEGEICNSDFECECPSGEKLFRGRCTGSGKLGGQCMSGRCRGRGVACNRSTNMCLCRGNCSVGTVCIRRRSGGKRRKSGW